MSGTHPDLATASSIAQPGRDTRQSPASISPTLPSRTPRPYAPTLATASSTASARTGYTSVTREQRRDFLDRRAGADRHLPIEVLA